MFKIFGDWSMLIYMHIHNTHLPLDCLTSLVLTWGEGYLWFTLTPSSSLAFFLYWLLHPLLAVVLTFVQLWQNQSRWVGWTSIFWWLTFLCAIGVDVEFVHWPENCRLLKLSLLFSFYLIYLLLFGNLVNISLFLIMASTFGDFGNQSPLDFVDAYKVI